MDIFKPKTETLVAVLVFLVTLGFLVWQTPHFKETVGYPTGDEPYYLLIAHSIVHDGDIELSNNFVNRDYFHYWPGDLYPLHETKTVIPGLYSKHTPGTAFLILPGYALLDWLGTILTLNLVGALIAANLYLLAWEILKRHSLALLSTSALMFANPFLSYSFLVFPDLPAALCTLYAYRRIHLDGVRSPLAGNNLLRLAGVGLCLGLLPWLHPRFMLISMSLLCYLIWREYQMGWTRNTVKKLLPLALPILLLGILYLAYNWILYSQILPNYNDHNGLGSHQEWIMAFFGSLFDQQWGLLIYAPIYVLAIVGLLTMAFKSRLRGDLAWIGIICIPYAAVIITYSQWWGEWCPAARYWVAVLPLVVVPLCQAMKYASKHIFWIVFGVLTALGWAIMAIFLYDPNLMYNHPTGGSHLLVWLTKTWHWPNMVPLLPGYVVESTPISWQHVILPVISLAIILLLWLFSQSKSEFIERLKSNQPLTKERLV